MEEEKKKEQDMLNDIPDMPSDEDYEAWKADLKKDGIIDMDDI